MTNQEESSEDKPSKYKFLLCAMITLVCITVCVTVIVVTKKFGKGDFDDSNDFNITTCFNESNIY